MLANSLFFNDSLLGQHFPTSASFSCFFTSPVVFIVGTFSVTNILLLLPLCIFILYFGFQQLRQQSPTSAISHSDSFTYHLVTMELIGTLGCNVSFAGVCMKNLNVFNLGIFILSFPWYGQTFFYTLTCIERYLAVVHPITYLSLKSEKWIRIRTITIGCIWLLCILGDTFVLKTNIIYLETFFLTVAAIIISICNLRVLCFLIRPGPGEKKEGRERVDQSKRRAFYIILVILGIVMLKLSFGLIANELDDKLSECTMTACTIWLNLPSSLALPLLFLQRRKNVLCCKK